MAGPNSGRPLATRIIGIDPGLAHTGWGIIDAVPGKPRAIAYGHITTDPKTERSLRLLRIHDGIVEVIERYGPSELAVESVFFGVDVKNALGLGEVRGASLLAAASRHIVVREYLPTQVKQTIVGQGQATKAQIQFMVKALLKLDHQPEPDHCSDALAVALCHAQMRR
jgi:crossover junction endodeoxyribonuclease RuvC